MFTAVLLAIASLGEWVEVIEPKGFEELPPGVRVFYLAGHPSTVKICSEILRGAGMW